MRVVVDERVKKFLDGLGESSSSRAFGYLKIFENYGFNLPEKYLKKVGQNIRELRPGRLRLFLYVKADKAVVVHIIVKKTQKIPKKEFKIIKQRVQDW